MILLHFSNSFHHMFLFLQRFFSLIRLVAWRILFMSSSTPPPRPPGLGDLDLARPRDGSAAFAAELGRERLPRSSVEVKEPSPLLRGAAEVAHDLGRSTLEPGQVLGGKWSLDAKVELPRCSMRKNPPLPGPSKAIGIGSDLDPPYEASGTPGSRLGKSKTHTNSAPRSLGSSCALTPSPRYWVGKMYTASSCSVPFVRDPKPPAWPSKASELAQTP